MRSISYTYIYLPDLISLQRFRTTGQGVIGVLSPLQVQDTRRVNRRVLCEKTLRTNKDTLWVYPTIRLSIARLNQR